MTSDRIQFIGHSSLWITLDDSHFIVDAHFSGSILGFLRRKSTVGIDPSTLPMASALLVTNGEEDHLDIFSYKYFSQSIPIVAPQGLGRTINRFVHNPVAELKPWTDQTFGSVRITALPAKHSGIRWTALQGVRSLGYLLSGSKTSVFVSGDSGYGPHFREIGKAFSVHAACLPLGPTLPRWLMRNRHLNAEETIQAFEDLGAKMMIPIHWGTFRLGLNRAHEPLDQLRGLIHGKPVEERIKILHPGQVLPLEAFASQLHAVVQNTA